MGWAPRAVGAVVVVVVAGERRGEVELPARPPPEGREGRRSKRDGTEREGGRRESGCCCCWYLLGRMEGEGVMGKAPRDGTRLVRTRPPRGSLRCFFVDLCPAIKLCVVVVDAWTRRGPSVPRARDEREGSVPPNATANGTAINPPQPNNRSVPSASAAPCLAWPHLASPGWLLFNFFR